jgi:glycosyltransferase involved in cell wall biosynthesis
MRFLSEYDPLVRKSARRAALSIATTEQTASRLRRMGVTKLEVLPAVAIDPSEIPLPGESSTGDRAGTVRFVSSGNLIDLKGLHLSVRAFAEAGLEQALYWIVGEGPARQKLEGLCRQLDVAGRIRFLGWLPRGEALCKLADCDALLVPSLHDSGSFVCLEAMAAGKPVICLDLGGPSLLVGEDCGVKVPAVKVNHAVRDLAAAMRRVAEDRAVALAMGEAGRRRVLEKFTWSSKIGTMASWYEKLLSEERAGLG